MYVHMLSKQYYMCLCAYRAPAVASTHRAYVASEPPNFIAIPRLLIAAVRECPDKRPLTTTTLFKISSVRLYERL